MVATEEHGLRAQALGQGLSRAAGDLALGRRFADPHHDPRPACPQRFHVRLVSGQRPQAVGDEVLGVRGHAGHRLRQLGWRRVSVVRARVEACVRHELLHGGVQALGLVRVVDVLAGRALGLAVGQELHHRGLVDDERAHRVRVGGRQVQADHAAAAVADDVRGVVAHDREEPAGVVGVEVDPQVLGRAVERAAGVAARIACHDRVAVRERLGDGLEAPCVGRSAGDQQQRGAGSTDLVVQRGARDLHRRLDGLHGSPDRWEGRKLIARPPRKYLFHRG